MNNDLELIYERMVSFAAKRFYDATATDHLEKLKQEAQEAKDNPEDIEEYADCLLCLFGAATKAKFTFGELLEATRNKLFIVENREWKKKPDSTYQHIEKSVPFGIAVLKSKQTYNPDPNADIPF